MLLSARILSDVAGINSFSYATTAQLTEGDTVDIYFQLYDMSVQGESGTGRRFIPASGAALSVTAGSIDDSKRLLKTAVQAFPLDGSIWKISITATDKIRGTADFLLKLTEGAKVTTGFVRQALSIAPATAAFI